MKLPSDECFWNLMISILVQVLSWTQTPITPPPPHLRPIYTLHHSHPEMCASQHSCNIDLLPSIQVKRIAVRECVVWFILMSFAVFIYHVLEFLWGSSECLPAKQGSCGVDPVCTLY